MECPQRELRAQITNGDVNYDSMTMVDGVKTFKGHANARRKMTWDQGGKFHDTSAQFCGIGTRVNLVKLGYTPDGPETWICGDDERA